MNKSKNTLWYRKRHKVINKLFSLPFRLVLRLKEDFRADKCEIPKGPALIISNHLTGLDPVKVALTIKEVAYYVATDDIFNKKFISPLMIWALNPIPKSKSVSDLKCVKTMIKVMNEGNKVMVFPEGNRSYSGDLCHVDKSIAKLVKISKVPLIILNIAGGFIGDPRWAKKPHKAENHCYLRKIVSKEEIAEMSNEDLYDLIVENLKVDQTVYNSNRRTKRAEYIERAMYYCPNCHKYETIYSHNNDIYCSECGYKATYNNDTSITLLNGEVDVKNLSNWYKLQEKSMREFDPFKNDDVIFSDYGVTLYQSIRFKKKKVLIKNGTITMSNKWIIVQNKKHRIEILIDEINESCAVLRHKVNFYFNDYSYQVDGLVRFNALKYVNLFHHIRNIKKNENGVDEFLGI